MKKIIRFGKYIIFTYVITGLVYSLAGYIYRAMIGKQEVFSPLIGIPSDIFFWPWMVYADLQHIGVGLADVLALVSLILSSAIFTRQELKLRKSIEKGDKTPVK